jgi:uncharacterized protein
VLLSRHPRPEKGSPGGGRTFAWDPEHGPAPAEALRGIDAVFHLAGEPVAEGRWTDDKKRRIRDSRELGTRNLVAGLAALEHKPKVLICASAVGYYGDRGDEELDESSAPGSGFLPEVCVAWEREAAAAEALGIRVVCVRIGIVLAAHGGALGRMMTPFKMGLGGKLGSGDQWMSWIHLDDLVGMMLHASLERELRGPMNGVSRTPVTNADFTHALGRALHRPAFLPVPRAALRIAFGEMSEIMMASQRVLPRVAARSGYTFRHPELDSALAAVVAASHRKAA